MRPLLLAVLAIVMLLPAASAQTPANLTGTWTMVSERSESPHQTPPVTSIVFTIAQTDAVLNVTAVRNGVTSEVSYPIRSNPKPTKGSVGVGVTAAYWDGPRLVTERAGSVQGQTVSVREVFGLNADGSEMTVETLVVVQHGYEVRGGKNYGAATDVFTKVP